MRQEEFQKKVLLFVQNFFNVFCESSPMGSGLFKEQELCFKLIQQLIKAAECLPNKGSLDLSYLGKSWAEVEITPGGVR